ncbi:HipA N-terminal domain-containing protein [Dyadobacter luteus]|uniref:HipA N-terminal domain-containing protein n=1 Tax=Dyadobacter luteus TaxID=2259619 RepID=UPI001E4CD38E|nr:HipA N-terminal domain-containing protein [Dyadobacter luteus]
MKTAATLKKTDSLQYIFRYEDSYFNDSNCLAISLSLSRVRQEYPSEVLFPFFFGLLSEGINKQTQCRLLRID